MMSTVTAKMYVVNDAPMFLVDEDIYYMVEEKKVFKLGIEETFVYEQDGEMVVATVKEKVNNMSESMLYREYGFNRMTFANGVDWNNCYCGSITEPYGAILNPDDVVYVIEKARPVDPTHEITCSACYKSFTFRFNGPGFVEQAREHVATEHVEDGRMDAQAIEQLLKYEQ